MAKFRRIVPQPFCMHQLNPIQLIKRSISFLTIQQNAIYLRHNKNCYINCTAKRILPTIGHLTIHNCDLSSYMSDEDNDNKKYNVVKNYSFQVPSFGGIISANTPADLTVSLSMATEIV